MEAVKPLVVLVLFGTILYGAYSVVQKGPSGTAEGTTAVSATDAPPFAAATASPQVELGGPLVSPSTPGVTPAVSAAPMPAAGASSPAAVPFSAAVPPAGPTPGGASSPLPPLPPPQGIPAAPPPPVDVAALAAGAAAGAAAGTNPPSAVGDTYLTPSASDSQPPATADVAPRPDRYADVGAKTTFPVAPPQPPVGIRTASPSSAAFAAAWADAHGKLTAGRYAEALAGLSVWYDDPSLGLEESQQLEDLLSRLAGTVVYSQQDLLQPPHVVAPGETLAAIAMPLGVSAQLLAKINGVEDAARLVPGEHLKVIRGPFDAVLSVSRRRLSLQLNGSYAGSFPVAIGRDYLARVGSILPVSAVGHGPAASGQAVTAAPARRAITLDGGLVIEAADDPSVAADATPASSLVVSVRDLGELIDILGPGSRVLVRQ